MSFHLLSAAYTYTLPHSPATPHSPRLWRPTTVITWHIQHHPIMHLLGKIPKGAVPRILTSPDETNKLMVGHLLPPSFR
jgi:hypothetical protein